MYVLHMRGMLSNRHGGIDFDWIFVYILGSRRIGFKWRNSCWSNDQFICKRFNLISYTDSLFITITNRELLFTVNSIHILLVVIWTDYLLALCKPIGGIYSAIFFHLKGVLILSFSFLYEINQFWYTRKMCYCEKDLFKTTRRLTLKTAQKIECFRKFAIRTIAI